MNAQTVRWLLSLFCLGVAVIANAGVSPVVSMVAPSRVLAVGDTVVVDTRVRNAPEVYGVEMTMAFDPAALEVVGLEGGKPVAKSIPGDFFPANELFFAANSAANDKGAIAYVATLLNPAKPVKGGGSLAKTAFRAKAPGRADIRISGLKFGTREGNVIVPELATRVLALDVGPVGSGGRIAPVRHVWVWIFAALLPPALVGVVLAKRLRRKE